MDEKITIDIEKIKETFELKEGCKYIIQFEDACEEERYDLYNLLKQMFNIDVVIISKPIKLYEIKNG